MNLFKTNSRKGERAFAGKFGVKTSDFISKDEKHLEDRHLKNYLAGNLQFFYRGTNYRVKETGHNAKRQINIPGTGSVPAASFKNVASTGISLVNKPGLLARIIFFFTNLIAKLKKQ